jgi:hypothetical protein
MHTYTPWPKLTQILEAHFADQHERANILLQSLKADLLYAYVPTKEEPKEHPLDIWQRVELAASLKIGEHSAEEILGYIEKAMALARAYELPGIPKKYIRSERTLRQKEVQE